MKKILLILTAVLALIGCNKNSYSSQRKAEDKLIENFLSRNNINVLTEIPADNYTWGENDYLLVPGYDNLYFHLRHAGDSLLIEGNDTTHIDDIQPQETVVMRYRKFALTEHADTLNYWSTLDQAFPLEFQYMNTSTCEATGWHVAVKYMKYTNAECQIICPSKLGFTADQNSVTPYCYILKMKIKR
ncbi:MAG: DUF4827 family protein [Paludibacteraceae bacterium]|nr:DUF4827 family protein [Paludibacteraceae bacterium]